MIVTRRSLFHVVAAGALASKIPRAKAATVATPWAVAFDGKTYIQNQGTLPGLPSSSRYLFLAFNYKSTAQYNYYSIISCPGSVSSGSWQNQFFCILQQYGSNEQISFGLGPNLNGDGLGIIGQVKPTLTPKRWHTVLMAYDTQGAVNFSTGAQTVAKAYVDGILCPVQITGCGGKGGSCDALAPALGGLPIYVGGTPLGHLGSTNGVPVGVNFVGELADVYFLQGINLYNNPGIDIDSPAFRAAFYNSGDETTARQAANGGSPALAMPLSAPYFSPQIFLTGPPKAFIQNFAAAGGTWGWPDNYNPPSSSGAFTVVGNLAVASDDPFTPGSFE